jgi:hypothetical protein
VRAAEEHDGRRHEAQRHKALDGEESRVSERGVKPRHAKLVLTVPVTHNWRRRDSESASQSASQSDQVSQSVLATVVVVVVVDVTVVVVVVVAAAAAAAAAVVVEVEVVVIAVVAAAVEGVTHASYLRELRDSVTSSDALGGTKRRVRRIGPSRLQLNHAPTLA